MKLPRLSPYDEYPVESLMNIFVENLNRLAYIENLRNLSPETSAHQLGSFQKKILDDHISGYDFEEQIHHIYSSMGGIIEVSEYLS